MAADFRVVSSSTLQWHISPTTVFSWCPTMELVAVTSQDSSTLFILRPNGQRVWTLSIKQAKIVEFSWRPDGKMMAVCGSNGVCCLYDTNKGKLVATLDDCALPGSKMASCWSRREGPFEKVGKFDNLADMDVVKCLPALSQLPNANESLKILSDELLRCEDSASDFLIVAGENGTLQMTLYGLFSMGGFDFGTSGTFVKIVSSKSLESHFAVLETEQELSLVQIDTQFVSKLGSFLPVMCVTISQTLNILNYLKGAMDILTHDCRPFIEFNERNISLLEEETRQDPNSTALDIDEPGYMLFELLLTGTISQPVQKWITDYIGDRGIKKWTKLAKQSLEGARKVLFTYMIPATERLILHLTRLLGHAQWSQHINEDCLIDPVLLEGAIQSASQFLRLLYRWITQINEEYELFQTFIAWLAYVLQDLSTDDPLEIVHFDVGRVSEYLQALNDSVLKNVVAGDKKTPQLHRKYEDLDDNMQSIFTTLEGKLKSMTAIREPEAIYKKGDKTPQINMRVVNRTEERVYTLLTAETHLELHTPTSAHRIDLGGIIEQGDQLQATFIDDKEILVLARGKHSTMFSFAYDTISESTTLTQDFLLKHVVFGGAENDKLSSFSPAGVAVNDKRVGCLVHQNHKDILVFET